MRGWKKKPPEVSEPLGDPASFLPFPPGSWMVFLIQSLVTWSTGQAVGWCADADVEVRRAGGDAGRRGGQGGIGKNWADPS